MTAQARVVLAEPIDRPTYAISVFLLSFGQRGLGGIVWQRPRWDVRLLLLGGRLVDGEGLVEDGAWEWSRRKCAGADPAVTVTAIGDLDRAVRLLFKLHQMSPCVRVIGRPVG
jgi:hypothetical protein